MKEQLSALIDGEFDVVSAEHLIVSAKTGGELKQCWANYHLIGDALRGDFGRGESSVGSNLSARIMAIIEKEPIIFHPNAKNTVNASTSIGTAYIASTSHNIFTRNSKSWSIAASVAAVMFVGVMVLQLNQSEELSPIEIAQSVPNEYLQAHQAAAPNGAAYYIQNANFSEQQPK